MRKQFAIAVLGTAVTLGTACSDDEEPTTEAYCEDLRALPEGDDPTAAFFADHPDPALEDWADGLPAIIATIQDSRDQFADVEPSAELADRRESAVQAMDVVLGSFEDALEAASANDQAEFDRLEAENQDENVPALMAAMAGLGDACGIEEG